MDITCVGRKKDWHGKWWSIEFIVYVISHRNNYVEERVGSKLEECEEEYNKGIKDEYSESRWNDVCNIQIQTLAMKSWKATIE